jgi:hypothetical protein
MVDEGGAALMSAVAESPAASIAGTHPTANAAVANAAMNATRRRPLRILMPHHSQIRDGL